MKKLLASMVGISLVISANVMAFEWQVPKETDAGAMEFVEANVDGWNVYHNEDFTLKTHASCDLPNGEDATVREIGNPLPTSFGPTDRVEWGQGARAGYSCGVHSFQRNINSVVEYSMETKILFLKNVVVTNGDEVMVFPSVTMELVGGKFNLLHIDTGKSQEVGSN